MPFGPLRDGVSTACNFSRFLKVVSELEAEQGLITAMTDAMHGELLAELPGFGEHLGYDGNAATGAAPPSSGSTGGSITTSVSSGTSCAARHASD